jgi:hypothetical protein
MQAIGVGSHNQAAQSGPREAEATRQAGARCEGDPTPALPVAMWRRRVGALSYRCRHWLWLVRWYGYYGWK